MTRLIDADKLYPDCMTKNGTLAISQSQIANAPTVELPENAVNCVLTMFGKCSYNKTGCSDCEIKDKIRKALNERLQGEWIGIKTSCDIGHKFYYCSVCHREIDLFDSESLDDYPFCHCGADMRGEEE